MCNNFYVIAIIVLNALLQFAKYRTKHLQGKLKQACNLRMVENLLYNKNKDIFL